MITPYTGSRENKTRAVTADSFHPPMQVPQPTPTLPPPVKDAIDYEFHAMRTVDTVLSRLDNATRARVLSWVHSRMLAMREVPASPTLVDGDTPWPSHTVDDIRPKVVDPGDAVADYEWPNVVVYTDGDKPIVTEGNTYTAAGARTVAAELLSAAHRVDTETT